MSLGPTCLLLGLVWGSCLQGGSPQGQVPTSPVMGVPAGQWWKEKGSLGRWAERLLGGGWSAAPSRVPVG